MKEYFVSPFHQYTCTHWTHLKTEDLTSKMLSDPAQNSCVQLVHIYHKVDASSTKGDIKLPQ